MAANHTPKRNKSKAFHLQIQQIEKEIIFTIKGILPPKCKNYLVGIVLLITIIFFTMPEIDLKKMFLFLIQNLQV